jgi:lipopolysaccharide/colanic/teichoic acid biosynthesis glycosyltransferase
MTKRALDIVIALLLLPLAVPLCLIAMALLLMDMKANPLFRQTRVGRYERPFTIFKLRTMKPNTVDAASHEIGQDQITRVGRAIRHIKFDELPQILNVLAGDMSFVGPRPCLPIQHELIDARARLGIYQLRPGITGPAQLDHIDMSDPERLAEADRAYLGNWSIARDLSILGRTLLGCGNGDAARAKQASG